MRAEDEASELRQKLRETETRLETVIAENAELRKRMDLAQEHIKAARRTVEQAAVREPCQLCATVYYEHEKGCLWRELEEKLGYAAAQGAYAKSLLAKP